MDIRRKKYGRWKNRIQKKRSSIFTIKSVSLYEKRKIDNKAAVRYTAGVTKDDLLGFDISGRYTYSDNYTSKDNCGSCARKCPFKSIIMDETGSYKIIQDKEGNTNQTPITYANRCDLCRGYSKRGCFTNCPSGALKMAPFNEVLLMLPQLHREKLKAPFLNGTWIISASLPKQGSLAG